MNYPKEFIEKCKEIYPNDERLHQMLDGGHTLVGRYLDDSSSEKIHINTILQATSLEQLKDKALKMKEKIELYNQWGKLYNDQMLNK